MIQDVERKHLWEQWEAGASASFYAKVLWITDSGNQFIKQIKTVRYLALSEQGQTIKFVISPWHQHDFMSMDENNATTKTNQAIKLDESVEK